MLIPSETPAAQQAKHNILVIDDEFGPRESLRILFKNYYQVTCVDNVDAGVKCIETSPPDVIIMDIKMPKKNGIDGLRDIRRIDANVSVIMLTGFGDLETATAALRLGANDYLTKPFNTSDFIKLVEHHVHRTLAARAYAKATTDLESMNTMLTAELQRREHLSSLGAKSSEFIHDLSNPFAVICMCVQMLTKHLQTYEAQGEKDTQMIKEFVKNINSSAKRCKDLFDLWRKAESKDTLSLKPANLQALLQDVAERANVMAAQKNATVRIQGSSPNCLILADETQLYRCFQNLVSNAVQAAPPMDGVVELFWRLSGDTVEIYIKDNGCGIPPHTIDRIFDPHFTTKQDSGGLGLGLFITKKLISLHNGTISLANNPGQGAIATVCLPIYTPQPAELPNFSTAPSVAVAAAQHT